MYGVWRDGDDVVFCIDEVVVWAVVERLLDSSEPGGDGVPLV